MLGKKVIEVDSDRMTTVAFASCLFMSILSLVLDLSHYVSGAFTVPAVTWTDYLLSAAAFFGVVAFRPLRALQVICGLLLLSSGVPILMHLTKASGELLQLAASGLALLRVVLGVVFVGFFIQWFRETVRIV